MSGRALAVLFFATSLVASRRQRRVLAACRVSLAIGIACSGPAAGGSAAASSDPVFKALLIDGRTASGRLISLGPGSVRLMSGDGRTDDLPINRLVKLTRESPPRRTARSCFFRTVIVSCVYPSDRRQRQVLRSGQTHSVSCPYPWRESSGWSSRARVRRSRSIHCRTAFVASLARRRSSGLPTATALPVVFSDLMRARSSSKSPARRLSSTALVLSRSGLTRPWPAILAPRMISLRSRSRTARGWELPNAGSKTE
jgi:hypothetical protein